MSDNDVFLNFLETENIDFVKIFIDIKLDDIKNLDYEWFGGIEDKAQGPTRPSGTQVGIGSMDGQGMVS